MPAKSQSQRGLIFGKRNKYGSKEKTPKKWMWIWSKDYENKGKLPDKVKESKIHNFETFVNENYKDGYDYTTKIFSRSKIKYTQLLEDCEWIKNKFSDYRDFDDFFKNINIQFNSKFTYGFGFFNATKSQGTPIMKDIAAYLISNDFEINIKELKDNHKILYFEDNMHNFRKYMENQINRDGAKKYYYYKNIKKPSWSEKYSVDEKVQYIKDTFKKHKISEKYDIHVNLPASMITVDIIEK